MKLGEITIPVKCGIGKYGLSAHADKSEIISLAHLLGARRIFFVHGGEEVTQKLAMEIQEDILLRICFSAGQDDGTFQKQIFQT